MYLFAMNVIMNFLLKTVICQTRYVFLHIWEEEGPKW